MKKRLISLMLMLAMAASMAALFTGCGSTGNTSSESSIKPMTITIAMITENETTEAGIQAVQNALNKITENNLNTHVVLQFYTAEEYDAAIEAKIKGRLEYRANNKTDLTSIGTDEDKTLNEYGREIALYPEPYENQIDIFLVNGVNNLEYYNKFPSAGVTDEEYEEDPDSNSESVIATLDSYLTAASGRLLTKYLSTTLLNACKINDELKAIPSNALYGNAEYLLIDKELFDKYSYDIDDVTDLLSLEAFLTDIAEKEKDVTPLYNYGSLGLVSVTGKNSAVAAVIPDNVDPSQSGLSPTTILSIAEFRESLTSINTYASVSGKYPVVGSDLSDAEKGTFAAGFISTDSATVAQYAEDYYTIMTRKAMASSEQVYNNAFAIFEYTTDQDRCMEVINLIQTNREFHNILLYGVENVTYTVDEDTGLIHRKHEGTDGAVYSMDMNLCGNLFISYLNDEMSEAEMAFSENDWAVAKEASRNIFYSPYMGFELELGDDAEHKQPSAEDIDKLESIYNEMFVKFADYPNAIDEETGEQPDIKTYLSTLEKWMISTENYLVTSQINTTTTSKSIKKQYINWWMEKYPQES